MKKILKKSLSVLIAVTIIFSSVYVGLNETDFSGVFAVRAKAASESDLTFTLNADGESYSVADCYTGAEGILVIPSAYNGLSVTSIGDYAFYGCDALTSITIPDSVTTIGHQAFYTTYYNEIAPRDNGVLYIGNHLVDVQESISGAYEIKEGTKSIAASAFTGCSWLTSIRMPNSITNVGENAFEDCSSLESIIISNRLTNIGTRAFAGCDNLANVYITNIAAWCDIDFGNKYSNPLYYANNFYLNGGLVTDVVIPDSVTSIGDYVYYGCDSLTSITIPSTITSMGKEAFYDCKNLQSVYITDILSWCSISYGEGTSSPLTYAKNLYLNGELVTDVIIPDSITTIPKRAFSCTSLKSITIHDNVKSIGDGVFAGCTSLASITIPDSVTSIGVSAFSGCTSLTSITIPDSVKSVGEYTFNNCKNLKSVAIPNSIKSIGDGAFQSCTSLTFITIPDSVTSIGKYAFSGSNLTSITIPDSVANIQYGTFLSCSNLTSVTIPDSVTGIGDFAFQNCDSLTSIIIPDSVIIIGEYAISYCDNLTSVTIGDSVTSISDGAFNSCTSLTSIIIPYKITNIGYYAFKGCSNLKYIFYTGLESEWAKISIDSSNTPLTSAVIHYNLTDHVYGKWITDVQPTCTQPGQKFHICSVCNYSETVDTDATGHSYGDWSIISEATCTQKGSRRKNCSVCGDMYTEEIPITDHQNLTWVTEQEPTCTVAGYKDEYCLDCGEKIGTEVIPVTDHLNTISITEQEPSCDEIGYKDEYCLDCGEKVGTEEIPATGHSYSTEWTIDTEPTCTEEGSKSHHCTVCGEKGDITVIVSLGHDYKVISTEEEHPHTISYKCSRCPETKEETSTSADCAICNFSYTNVDDETCKITGYIGNENTFVMPGTIDGRTVTTTTTGAFKNNTTLTSVRIESGVESIGALSFLGCTSLSKVVIPESISSIGTNAFYNCASDFTIYCYRDSYAMQYAIDNSIDYVIMDVGETKNSVIDYKNELIFTLKKCVTNILDILYIPETSMVFAEASHISGNNEFLGTGTKITVFDNDEISSEYTLVVEGDTNGDSVCDVLDCAQVALASNGFAQFSGAYLEAGDADDNGEIDVNDYQSIVNSALVG